VDARELTGLRKYDGCPGVRPRSAARAAKFRCTAMILLGYGSPNPPSSYGSVGVGRGVIASVLILGSYTISPTIDRDQNPESVLIPCLI
jgi:hypothetical protein